MPLTSLLDNEFEFMVQLGIAPSEIMSWWYWKFEYFIDKLNKKNEDETKSHKKQQEETQGSMPNMSAFNPSSLMSKASSMMR